MNKRERKLRNRILAVCTVVVMVASIVLSNVVIPERYEVDASTTHKQNVFTFIVMSQGKLINDAHVKVYSQDTANNINEERKTDENGEVAFQEFSSREGKQESLTCAYTVQADGYVDMSGTISSKKEGWCGNKVIELTKLPNTITANSYSGPYDGVSHAAVTVTGTNEGDTVAYSTDGNRYSDIVPQIKNKGTMNVFIQVKRASGESVTFHRIATVSAGERSDFAFATPCPADVVDEGKNVTYTNVANSSMEPRNITYTSLNTDVATVDKNGTVHFQKSGIVQIRATMDESNNYKSSTATYIVTAITGAQALAFTSSHPSNITYSDTENTFSNPVKYNDEESTITYAITAQMRDGHNVQDVATIDQTTGKLTINNSGTVKVTAKATGGTIDGKSKSYSLTIQRANQKGFTFALPGLCEVEYGKSYINKALGGLGTGKVTYRVKENIDTITLSQDGRIRPVGLGNAIVEAQKAEDKKYNAITAEYSVNVIPAEQTGFAFPDTEYSIGCNTKDYTVSASGGPSDATINYEIVSGSEIGRIDNTGKLMLYANRTGDMIIKATRVGNGYYKATVATCIIHVKDTGYFSYCDIAGKMGSNGWYTSDVLVKPYENYKIGYFNSLDHEWKDSISYSEEGLVSEQTVYFCKTTDPNRDSISEAITIPSLKIDKTAPSVPTVSYPSKITEGTIEGKDYSFYKDKVIVEIEASDTISGIDHFTYNLGDGDIVIPKEEIQTEGGNAKASFTIEPQYKGKVQVTAYDAAGLSASYNERTAIVVDNIAPGVTVTYDNRNAANGSYYNGNRTATIAIAEDNFDDSDVEITCDKKNTDATQYSAMRIPGFRKDGSIYKTTIQFTEEADYRFDIKYEDKSGNVYDDYTMEEFTIDKTDPAVALFVDNIQIGSNDKPVGSNTNSSITIKVSDRNFDPTAIMLDLNARNQTGALYVNVDKYMEKIQDPDNWRKEGDIYSTTLILTDEAYYSIGIQCRDLAGNIGISQHTNICVCDRTPPTDLQITYSEAEDSPLDEILNVITFGYYKKKMQVTLSATDIGTGVDQFVYSYGVTGPTSDKNKGVVDHIYEGTIDSDGSGNYSATFEIDPEFEGTVSFYAVDGMSNNSTICDGDRTLVVDSLPPVIDVAYDNNNVRSTSYYKAPRKATIKITESHLAENGITVKVGKRGDTDTSYQELTISPEFVKDGDTYTTEYTFKEDGDYYLDITCRDRSTNESHIRQEFTIDTTKPTISVRYDNNTCKNKNQFNTDRTATIVIKEHNFDAKDIKADVVLKDVNGTIVNDTYSQYLMTPSSWKSTGDVHTATISFQSEGNYEVGISCLDKAGNANSSIDYHDSVAVSRFTIDKTCPTGMLTIGDWTKSLDGREWNQFLNGVSFNLYSKTALKVAGTAEDTLSGLDTVEYLKSNKALTLNQVKAAKGWTKTAEKSTFAYTVKKDSKFIVYLHIVDKAGNERYLSSDGVVLDKTAPRVTKLAPEVTIHPHKQPLNGIYHSNVGVDVEVIDPVVDREVYSGLREISYEVLNMGKVTQSGTLYSTKSSSARHKPLQQYSKANCITVDKDKNNSNDVEIKITAIDNAGNLVMKAHSIKIDTTKPMITVSYNNNAVYNKNYFTTGRTASITVTERNFASKDVKLLVTSKGGQAPRVSGWKKVSGAGNGDSTKWVATLAFKEDADYTFDMQYVDQAGNAAQKVNFVEGTVAPTEFTVDKTNPVVAVTYDNNNVKSGSFYKANRTATIVITEHNFDASRVTIEQTAVNNGKSMKVPKVSGWSSKGDKNVATITYAADAQYTFDISTTDKAGNEAADYQKQSFTIDKTVPELEITGITNNSANNGTVAPTITYSDTNYDKNQVSITLVGATRNKVDLDGDYSTNKKGASFKFNNFAKKKEVDDLYTLTARLTDKAGNTVEKKVTFSVNRFGSTYALNATTKKLNGSFVQNSEDVIITETNVNELKDIKVTLFKNDKTVLLGSGNDYKIESSGGNGTWYQYTYTIFSKNFTEDGIYRISVQSTDSAGNVAENTLDTKTSDISFGVDHTKPNTILSNLESGKTYPVDQMAVTMNVSDNLKLSSVVVYLDGTEYKTWGEEDVKKLEGENGEYNFGITGDSTKAHSVKVVSTDAAGNENITQIDNFYVTKNLLVRYYNNKGVFYGSIVIVFAIMGGIIMLVVLKSRKKTQP